MLLEANNMVEDLNYCMSSFLRFRTIVDHNKCFSLKLLPNFVEENKDRTVVNNSYELEEILKKETEKIFREKKAVLCLSGGIDSAILARYVPAGSTVYTFKCVVPGVEVVDETPQAKKYSDFCNLHQKVIEIYWEDFEKYAPILMKHKGAPIHSIEVQIYKAALEAKKDGFDTLVFGESADVNFGGFNGLLSQDWNTTEFIKRFTYLDPKLVLNEPVDIVEPFYKYSLNNKMDVHEFLRHQFYVESINSYYNACETANIHFFSPFTKTYLGPKLDLNLIRNGRNKYLVREVFERLYPGFSVPPKIPMPRATNEWLKNWSCQKRKQFRDDINYQELTGDQKWLLYSLNTFLNLINVKG